MEILTKADIESISKLSIKTVEKYSKIMSKGKRGVITQTGIYVKINNDLYKRLTRLPKWNSNKNQTINDCISQGLKQTEWDLRLQQEMDL